MSDTKWFRLMCQAVFLVTVIVVNSSAFVQAAGQTYPIGSNEKDLSWPFRSSPPTRQNDMVSFIRDQLDDDPLIAMASDGPPASVVQISDKGQQQQQQNNQFDEDQEEEPPRKPRFFKRGRALFKKVSKKDFKKLSNNSNNGGNNNNNNYDGPQKNRKKWFAPRGRANGLFRPKNQRAPFVGRNYGGPFGGGFSRQPQQFNGPYRPNFETPINNQGPTFNQIPYRNAGGDSTVRILKNQNALIQIAAAYDLDETNAGAVDLQHERLSGNGQYDNRANSNQGRAIIQVRRPKPYATYRPTTPRRPAATLRRPIQNRPISNPTRQYGNDGDGGDGQSQNRNRNYQSPAQNYRSNGQSQNQISQQQDQSGANDGYGSNNGGNGGYGAPVSPPVAVSSPSMVAAVTTSDKDNAVNRFHLNPPPQRIIIRIKNVQDQPDQSYGPNGPNSGNSQKQYGRSAGNGASGSSQKYGTGNNNGGNQGRSNYKQQSSNSNNNYLAAASETSNSETDPAPIDDTNEEYSEAESVHEGQTEPSNVDTWDKNQQNQPDEYEEVTGEELEQLRATGAIQSDPVVSGGGSASFDSGVDAADSYAVASSMSSSAADDGSISSDLNDPVSPAQSFSAAAGNPISAVSNEQSFRIKPAFPGLPAGLTPLSSSELTKMVQSGQIDLNQFTTGGAGTELGTNGSQRARLRDYVGAMRIGRGLRPAVYTVGEAAPAEEKPSGLKRVRNGVSKVVKSTMSGARTATEWLIIHRLASEVVRSLVQATIG